MCKITEHLVKPEITCHCGCGYSDLDISIAEKFEEIRKRIGNIPISISSGCRCWEHHVKIYIALGSKPPKNSMHLEGKALDLKCPYGIDYEYFYNTCCDVIGDSGGVGYYPNDGFVHIDIRGYKSRW